MKFEDRCLAEVARRDTYRVNRSGRGARFTMHYAKGQCKRARKTDEFCTQHARMVAEGWYIIRCRW